MKKNDALTFEGKKFYIVTVCTENNQDYVYGFFADYDETSKCEDREKIFQMTIVDGKETLKAIDD